MATKRSLHAGILGLAIVSGCATARIAHSTERPVSLRGILAYAQRHSPLLRVARAKLSRGDAAVAGATPFLPDNPTLSASAGPRFSGGATGVDIEIAVEQRFEIAGERGLRLEAAEGVRELTRMELAEARWRVHQRVHALFHQALVARERSIAANEFLRFTERLLSIAQRRMKAGDISPLQVRIAEGELAQARQAKIAADGAYHAARLSLAEISGWPVKHPPRPTGSLDQPRRAPTHERLVRLAFANYPGLHTKAAAVRSAESRLRMENREAWPEPSVGVAYARESDPAAGVGAFEGTDIALVTLGVPLPVWQRNRAGRARARADLAVARAKNDALRRSLRVRVVRAAVNTTAGADRVSAYGREILPAFERNLELLRRSFELGEVDLLGVLVAQRRFLEVEQDALTAYEDYFRAVAELEAVVGAEIWPDERQEPEGDKR